MRKFYTAAVFCLIQLLSFAQQEIKAVESDQEINEVFTVKDLYKYPQFRQGKVFFRDGTIADAKLNYHKLFEQFLFLNDNGDSLAVGNPETIRVIVMDKDSFYYDKGSFYEMVYTQKAIQLWRRQSLREIDQQKNGAYGSSYTNNSTVAGRKLYSIDGIQRLNVGESTLFLQATEYYISYKHNDFLPATKKNIEKLFSGNSKQIREYIKDNSIDVTKEEGLRKILNYINGL